MGNYSAYLSLSASGVARGQRESSQPSPILKKLLFEKSQICNKIDKFEGRFELVSGTALSVQNREYLYIQGCVSSMFKGSDQKYFQSAELPHIGQSFYLHSRWHSNKRAFSPYPKLLSSNPARSIPFFPPPTLLTLNHPLKMLPLLRHCLVLPLKP